MFWMIVFTVTLIAFFVLSAWSDNREVVATPDRPVEPQAGLQDGSSPGAGQAAQA
jgi:hypothetical protein